MYADTSLGTIKLVKTIVFYGTIVIVPKKGG